MLFPAFYTNMFISLAKYQVKYLLVGGHAVNFHDITELKKFHNLSEDDNTLFTLE